MIYDNVKKLVRRCGKGWSVVAVNEDGSPSFLLKSFLARDGYWKHYDEDSCGMNEINWEADGDVICFENPYTEEVAIVKKEVLTETIDLLRQWETL